MGKCSVRFPILEPGDSVTVSQALGLSKPPKYLTCELEADHGGRHYDKSVGWWQFVPSGPDVSKALFDWLVEPLESAGHVNCRCELPAIDSAVALPPWWVAERCDEVFGPTAPELFFPVLR